jgi:hypothetical protein
MNCVRGLQTTMSMLEGQGSDDVDVGSTQSLSKSKLVHGSIRMTTYYYISEGVEYQGPIR